MHVRSPRIFIPRRQVNVRLFRHLAQQATSEKKRISTVNRRPRAYTANAQQRSVFPMTFTLHIISITPLRIYALRMRQSFLCLLLSDSHLTHLSPRRIFSPPTPDKPFVFSFMNLVITLTKPKALP